MVGFFTYPGDLEYSGGGALQNYLTGRCSSGFLAPNPNMENLLRNCLPPAWKFSSKSPHFLLIFQNQYKFYTPCTENFLKKYPFFLKKSKIGQIYLPLAWKFSLKSHHFESFIFNFPKLYTPRMENSDFLPPPAWKNLIFYHPLHGKNAQILAPGAAHPHTFMSIECPPPPGANDLFVELFSCHALSFRLQEDELLICNQYKGCP